MTKCMQMAAAESISSELTRRGFLMTTAAIGGGLAIGLGYSVSDAAAATINSKPWLPPSEGGVEVGAWVIIAPDNTLTLRIPQSELGQQVFTSNAMMLCEELECDWSKVGVMYIDVTRHLRENKVYGLVSTGASQSVRLGRQDHQLAGATIREQLKTAAAQQWNVPAAEIDAKNSTLTHRPTGRRLTYGEMASRAAAIRLPAPPKIKSPEQYTLIGTRVKQLGQDLRVSGTATFGIDVVLPGMLYAAVKMPPTQGGKLKGFNFDSVKGRTGVVAAMAIEGEGKADGIALIADNWWRARTALDAMPVEWDAGSKAGISSKEITEAFRKKMDEPGAVLVEIGDAEGVIKAGGKIVEGLYETPYQNHATIEPMNCTAQVTDDKVEIWLGTQGPEGVLNTATRMTKLPLEKVLVRNCFIGTGFGGRSRGEVEQAIFLARAMKGRPIQVLWSREEDMRHSDKFHPASMAKFKAVLGADGMPSALAVRKAGDAASATETVMKELAVKGVKAARVHNQTVRGLQELPYAIPNQKIDIHYMDVLLGTGAMRGTGSLNNVFVVESLIDECAHAAGKDPYQYRRALIAATKTFEHRDAWLKALDAAAEMSGWGKPLPQGTARGIALDDRRRATSFADVTVAAVVATVTVSKDGDFKLDRVDMALDYGYAMVNPYAIEQQMRGQMAFALGLVNTEITVRNGRIVEGNFDDYPLARMADYPKTVNIQLMKSDKWIYGIGEEVIPQTMPAICNAIFAVTGKRIRSLPIRNHDLSWT